MLKTMEEKDWIYREKDPEDGRSVRIFLTSLGREKREISRQSVKEFNKKVSEKVSNDDLRVFLSVIQTISKVADDKDSVNSFLKRIKQDIPE